MDNSTERKYQWSKALGGGEILVIRGDNWTEFKADVELGKIWLNNEENRLGNTTTIKPTGVIASEETVKAIAPKVDHTRRMWDGLYFEDYEKNKLCPECGEEAWVNEGVSKKTGKPYKNIKCKKNPEHITWGTP